MILSRKLVRFATPVTTNFHTCSCNSSTPSLKQFQSTTMSFITLQQHATEVGNGLETFHPVWSGVGNPGLGAQQSWIRFLVLPLASQDNLPPCLSLSISVKKYISPL